MKQLIQKPNNFSHIDSFVWTNYRLASIHNQIQSSDCGTLIIKTENLLPDIRYEMVAEKDFKSFISSIENSQRKPKKEGIETIEIWEYETLRKVSEGSIFSTFEKKCSECLNKCVHWFAFPSVIVCSNCNNYNIYSSYTADCGHSIPNIFSLEESSRNLSILQYCPKCREQTS